MSNMSSDRITFIETAFFSLLIKYRQSIRQIDQHFLSWAFLKYNGSEGRILNFIFDGVLRTCYLGI